MLTLAVVSDLLEEGWYSMDLAADKLVAELRREGSIGVEQVRPAMRRRFSREGGPRALFNADRFLNRFWDYPGELAAVRSRCRLFHVADHSYAHLVSELPAAKTGVFCHDLDAFRCLWERGGGRRTWLHRLMARRQLAGLRRAAVVFYAASAVGRQLRERGLVEPSRLVQALYGVSETYRPEAGPCPLPPELAALRGRPYLLHVGSCIPRKRIADLLDIFAAAHARTPELALIQAGGTWSAADAGRIARRGLAGHVGQVRLPAPAEESLAALYRGARAVLLPSESEGFGLPVVEALACGTTVIASDIPVLREVGGDAALYRPVGDVDAWASALDRLPEGPLDARARVEWARRFSWSRHARTVLEAYRALDHG